MASTGSSRAARKAGAYAAAKPVTVASPKASANKFIQAQRDVLAPRINAGEAKIMPRHAERVAEAQRRLEVAQRTAPVANANSYYGATIDLSGQAPAPSASRQSCTNPSNML